MNPIRTLEQFDFHHVLAETPGVSLVVFGTRQCGACRRVKELLLEYAVQDPDLHLFYVDAERDLALTREFEIFHLPALYLYVDGRFHRPLHCEATLPALAAALQETLAAPAEEAP